MKKYEQYKDSGIQWLGQVPEHWEVLPMKRMFSFGKGLSITKADLTPEGYPVISYGQVHSKQNTGTHTDDGLLRFVPESIINGNESCQVYPGDFIFADTSEDLDGCGNCAYIDRDGVYAGYHALVARPSEYSRAKYLAYLFLSSLWRSQLRSSVYGIKVFSVTQAILKDVTILLPSKDDAEKIVSYLDHKVSKINTVITEKEKMIADMEKYRFSLISETVTKGLNPNATMKDSGVDWIGEIPENWDVSKAKYYIAINSGEAISPVEIGEAFTYPVYGGGESMGKCEKYNVDQSNILLGRVGARCGCVTQPSSKAWATDNALVVTTTLHQRFLFYCLSGANLNRLNESNAQPLITGTKVKNLLLPIPSDNEQKEIAKHLDEHTSKIDALISELTSQIEDLKAYKQSVITEAVTGQVDVRDWTPKDK